MIPRALAMPAILAALGSIALGSIALVMLAASPAAASAPETPLEAFEAAVEDHPADPDLSWGLVRTIAETGDLSRAIPRLREHLARWPERPPGAWLVLGRWLQQQQRDEEALAAFAEALARDPGSGVAHLHAGLSAKRLGRAEEAAAHFDVARRQPGLEAEAGLMAGLARLDLGDEQGARHVLGEVVAGHRESEAARAARLVLQGSTAPRAPFLSLDAYGGVQFDSNVTLESGVDLPGASSDQDDVRFQFGAGATLRPLRGERVGVDVGLRYDQTNHVDFDEYDTRRVLGLVGGRYRMTRRTALRIDGWVGYTTLDDEPFLLEASLRPSFLVDLGPPAGLVRLHAVGTRSEYDEEPIFASLERDGWSYGVGLEHIVALPLREGAWTAWGGGYTRFDTEAETDLLGFDGAFDRHEGSAQVRLHVPLVYAVAADLRVGFDAERYDNRNLIDGLTDGGVGRPDPRRRRDDVWNVGAVLTRPLGRFTEVEVAWGFTDRASNVDLYAYDRHVVGLTVRVQTP